MRKIKIKSEEEKRIEQLEKENQKLKEQLTVTQSAMDFIIMNGGI